jgi:hypothetical protein
LLALHALHILREALGPELFILFGHSEIHRLKDLLRRGPRIKGVDRGHDMFADLV